MIIFNAKLLIFRLNQIGECQIFVNIMVAYHVDGTRNGSHLVHVQNLFEDTCQYRGNTRRRPIVWTMCPVDKYMFTITLATLSITRDGDL